MNAFQELDRHPKLRDQIFGELREARKNNEVSEEMSRSLLSYNAEVEVRWGQILTYDIGPSARDRCREGGA